MDDIKEILTGEVVYGKQLGRTMGFPTANMQVGEEAFRHPGVYYGRCEVDGRAYRVIINIGRHPTVPDGAPTVEAHLIGYEGNLYGRMIRVELIRYMRGEVRFQSVEELKIQLEKDRAEACRMPL